MEDMRSGNGYYGMGKLTCVEAEGWISFLFFTLKVMQGISVEVIKFPNISHLFGSASLLLNT
jgi:hypothetical protein